MSSRIASSFANRTPARYDNRTFHQISRNAKNIGSTPLEMEIPFPRLSKA
jgi:hypothetical protein